MRSNRQHRRRTAIGLAAVAVAIASSADLAIAADDHGHSATPAAAAVAHDTKSTAKAAPTANSIPADVAVKMMADGNERFTAGKSDRLNLTEERRCDTYANGQHPYAAVLSCADSRVPVEHVLDAGIGDLFVVRVAGNVADVDEIGTIEYGVEHLGINAILVMGHTKCGAVTAVVDKAHVSPNIAKLVDNIVPAADAARRAFPQLNGPRLVSQTIRLNVRRSMADLVANSDIIRERVKNGSLKIVGGVYDLHTGEVDWLEQSTGVASTDNSRPTVPATAAKEESPKYAAAAHADEPRHTKTHGPAEEPAHKPAKSHDSHGETASAKKNDEHGTKDDKDEHGDAHAAASTQPAQAPKKENFLALGALLGGASIVSFFIFGLIGGGNRKHAPAPAEKKAKPAKH